MNNAVINHVRQAGNAGISVEVLDPRTLVPLDKEMILKSVKKTGRLVIVSEDVLTCGVTGAMMAGMLTTMAMIGMRKMAPLMQRIYGQSDN